MADNESSSFISMKVPELQNFLKARDLQITVDGKKRKRAELLELCKNAAEMKVSKVDEEIELQDDLIKSKITQPGGNRNRIFFTVFVFFFSWRRADFVVLTQKNIVVVLQSDIRRHTGTFRGKHQIAFTR